MKVNLRGAYYELIYQSNGTVFCTSDDIRKTLSNEKNMTMKEEIQYALQQ